MEYITLADGTKIDPKTRRPVKEGTQEKYYTVPSHSKAVQQVTAVRRRMADLPLPPKQMNAVSLVVFYSLFGMSEQDIAIALGITESQVQSLRAKPEYGQIKEDLLEGIAEQDKDDVRRMFTAASRSAVERLIAVAEDEDTDDKNIIAAVNSILDRAGHRPVDIVEHRHKMEGGLSIQYVIKDEREQVPIIDVTPEDDDGDG